MSHGGSPGIAAWEEPSCSLPFLFGSTLGGSYYCHSNLANEETEARRGSDLAKVPKW